MDTSFLIRVDLKREKIYFYFGFILLIIYRVIKSSTIFFDDHNVTYIFIFLPLLLRFLHLTEKILKLTIIILLMPILALCFCKSWDPVIPIVILFLIVSKDIEFDEIVRVSYYTVFTLVSTIVFLAFVGIIEDVHFYTYMERSSYSHGAGFNHNSILPTYYCYLFFERMYIKRFNIHLKNLIPWILGAVVIYYYCGERLRFYLLLIACLLILTSWAFKYIKYKVKRSISICIYPVLFFICNYLGYNYDYSNPYMNRINYLLSNRLYYEHLAFNRYGVPLLGQNINMGEEAIYINGVYDYFYIDAGYVYLMIVYGTILGLLILAVYSIGAYKSSQISNSILLIWFICMAIDTLVGNQLLSIWINPLLFVPFCVLNKCKNETILTLNKLVFQKNSEEKCE